jgi:hypothetical protein
VFYRRAMSPISFSWSRLRFAIIATDKIQASYFGKFPLTIAPSANPARPCRTRARSADRRVAGIGGGRRSPRLLASGATFIIPRGLRCDPGHPMAALSDDALLTIRAYDEKTGSPPESNPSGDSAPSSCRYLVNRVSRA